jgi:hypothetical protein
MYNNAAMMTGCVKAQRVLALNGRKNEQIRV